MTKNMYNIGYGFMIYSPACMAITERMVLNHGKRLF